MDEQDVCIREMLGLRERAEDSLQDGCVGAELHADRAQARELAAEPAHVRVEKRKLLPILRRLDYVPDVPPRALGVAFPDVVRAPILEAEGRSGGDFDEIEVEGSLE